MAAKEPAKDYGREDGWILRGLSMLERLVAAAERGADALERDAASAERGAAALEGIRAQFEAAGVPGSAFDRARKAVGSVRTAVGAVRLWTRVRGLLGPSEARAVREELVGVLSGLLALPPGKDVRAESELLLDGANEKRARWHDERRAKGAPAK